MACRTFAVAAEVLPEAGRPGTDYVLIARAATLRRAYRELVDDLRVSLERVAQRKPPQGAGTAKLRGAPRSGRGQP